MTEFVVDPRLQADSCLIAQCQLSQVRLINNCLFPWMILVPRVQEYEIHHLDYNQQTQLQKETIAIARFLETTYKTDKINIGAIGNIVRQLHIHIIGRFETDIAWPGVVWGIKEIKPYTPEQMKVISNNLNSFLGECKV